MHDAEASHIRRVAFVGNYMPRKCGLATFTTDLCEAVAGVYADAVSCLAIAVNDTEAGYAYPPRVEFELREKDIGSYRRAAEFLNSSHVDVVCLQHEYGIFGGSSGSHILALLRNLQMPVVTTFHTVLQEPGPEQLRVLKDVAALSDRVVVMSRKGVDFLKEIYEVAEEKIDMIHHGVPDIPFADSSSHKERFGVEGKTVLMSFGLLSANKGIETVISALPEILKHHPDVVYLIVGATHPHVVKEDGELYRLSLQRRAQECGVAGHVIFHNAFVTLEQLIDFIRATDLYITPYLNPAQITSGTLAYTLSAGKAVISTPYWYAEELLADGRGALFPFGEVDALVRQVLAVLDDESKGLVMRRKAYAYGRRMIWPHVAERYMESFALACEQRERRRGYAVKPLSQRPADLPALNLTHLLRLTDDTGLIQHATYIVPNYAEGYCIDDNARGLLVSMMLAELELSNGHSLQLATRYLAFIDYAFHDRTGRFRNFMNYQRTWLEEKGSADSHGRTLWALGAVLGRSDHPSLRGIARRLFDQALPALADTTSPRAWAFGLFGIHEALKQMEPDPSVHRMRDLLANRLLELYRACRTDEWCWFEHQLTYCNPVLPHALLLCGHSMSNPGMEEVGLNTLHWLAGVQRKGDHFSPVGTNGFFPKGGECARFDQQPVEAHAMVSACLEACRSTGDAFWMNEAQITFEWFLGRNQLGMPLYDPGTGGCRDGLHPDRPNENQGAESTLAFLQTLLELRLAETPDDPPFHIPSRST
jgi:glycosyltransferase involved in cell wall biosynthesis